MSNRVVKTAIFRQSVTVTSIGSGGTSFTFASVVSGLWTVISATVTRASGGNLTAVALAFGADNGVPAGQPQGGTYAQAFTSSSRAAWTQIEENWLIPGSGVGTATAWIIGNGATGDVIEVEIVAELRESGEATAGQTVYT